MALPRDANGNVVQAVQPIDGSLQRVSPAAGARTRVALQFADRACLVGVRVRAYGAIAHPRLGEANVDAALTDIPLTVEDGWFFMSLAGKSGANAKKVTHVSILAESAAPLVDIIELE